MEQLIKALQIFLKYGNPQWPTHCEHDTLYVMIHPDEVSVDDKAALEELGFIPDEQCGESFISFRYGSA